MWDLVNDPKQVEMMARHAPLKYSIAALERGSLARPGVVELVTSEPSRPTKLNASVGIVCDTDGRVLWRSQGTLGSMKLCWLLVWSNTFGLSFRLYFFDQAANDLSAVNTLRFGTKRGDHSMH